MVNLEALEDQVRSAVPVGALKRAHRAQRKSEARQGRRRVWREWHCFWTWPLGHEFGRVERLIEDSNTTVSDRQCVGCEKRFLS